ncbi:MAG: Slp family lipoprotein [Thermodesulfobacteriota bacterium]
MRKIILIAIIILLSGCGSVISREARRGVDRSITPSMVQIEPDTYSNQKIIWGGIIISTNNLKDRSIIEVLHIPSKRTGEAGGSESPQGRFLINAIGYLDPLTYRKDMKIVVAGSIKGIVVKKLDVMEYTYPLIEPVEMHLFNPGEERVSPY